MRSRWLVVRGWRVRVDWSCPYGGAGAGVGGGDAVAQAFFGVAAGLGVVGDEGLHVAAGDEQLFVVERLRTLREVAGIDHVVFGSDTPYLRRELAYTLGGSGPYAGQTVTGGSWAALDPATGKILWQTPDPQGAFDISFVSTANGVVYGGSLAATGTNMYALDAATGKILWSFAGGGSVTGGASIVDGSVYWGSGYCGTACFTAPTNNNKVYAFGLR
jgi:outer membrane protein assembly factor BamB